MSTEQPQTTESVEETPDGGPVAELHGVDFGYTATPVVEDIDLRIDPGEYVAVVGPNGSGKSTVMQLLLGLLEPDTGTARLFGDPSHRFDDGERLAGLQCVAAPVTDDQDRSIAAISVSYPVHRVDDGYYEEVANAVLGAANVVELEHNYS